MAELNHSQLRVVRTGAVLKVFVVHLDLSAGIGKNILAFKEQAEKYTFSAFFQSETVFDLSPNYYTLHTIRKNTVKITV